MTSKSWTRRLWRTLGPGLITGAADDDPSGIATYSQSGAQFGFAMLWVPLITLPLMSAIQIASARIGRVTGAGLAVTLQRILPRPLLWALIVLLVVTNTINISADLAAMGAAAALVVKGPAEAFALSFGALCLGAELFVPYHRFAPMLKWLTMILLLYVATAFAVDVPWSRALLATFWPSPVWGADYLMLIVAVLGTTISPYLFFWQAAQEVEELRADAIGVALCKAHGAAAKVELSRINTDTVVGMTFSNLIAYFIILTTAATLHTHGIGEIESANQAAEALRPIAGDFAFACFALGIIGTGLLAVPVLAGSAAYAVADMMNWNGSLEAKPRDATGFYIIVAIATVAGAAIGLTGINPIKLLVWAAVVNGFAAVPFMVALMLAAGSRHELGPYALNKWLTTLGWVATVSMALAALMLVWVWLPK